MTNEWELELDAIWQSLGLHDPGSDAARVLHLCALRGICDTAHVDGLGITPSARTELLERLVKASVLTELAPEEKLRLGRGAPRSAYGLTPLGAQACLRLGAAAHAYEQTHAAAQRHDLHLVDLALAARAAGHTVELEHHVRYSEENALRFDAVIQVVTGARPVIFELEGAADWRQRARILDKILRLCDLSDTQSTLPYAPDIRVLFMVNRPDVLDAVYRAWAEGLTSARAERGRALPVCLWGQAIGKFLEQPDWTGLNGFTRLDDPVLVPDYGALAARTDPASAEPDSLMARMLPPGIASGPGLGPDERVRLQAHTRLFRRYLERVPPRTFSPEFFDAVRDIYALAHPDVEDGASIAELLNVPWVALLTLRSWVLHYPDLVQALQQAQRRYQGARRSGALLSLQAATEVVQRFLEFHGLRADGPLLQVWVAQPGTLANSSRFRVQVEIRYPRRRRRSSATWGDAELLLASGVGDAERAVYRPWWAWSEPEEQGESLLPSDRQSVELTCRALEWVLQQLLDEPEVLGIQPPGRQSGGDKPQPDKRAKGGRGR